MSTWRSVGIPSPGTFDEAVDDLGTTSWPVNDGRLGRVDRPVERAEYGKAGWAAGQDLVGFEELGGESKDAVAAGGAAAA